MAKPILKTFVVTINNGKPSFHSDSQRILFYQFLSQYEGKKVWMTLDTKLPKRSNRQNAFYWIYLEIIAEETGHTAQELHSAFKQRFLFGGATNVYGEVIRATKSTSGLTKGQFSDYLENICALTGVPIPSTEIWDLAPLLKNP